MSKRFQLAITFIVALFITLFLALSYFSRLATDDYYFIGDIKNHGTFEQVYFQYMNWTGRYAATLPINIIYNVLGLNQTFYNLLPPLSLLLLIAGVYFLFKNIFIYYSLEIKKKLLLLYSFLFSALLFFLSYDISESWFWYCGYSSYLWSITALIWGIGFIINKNNKWYVTLFASICFMYVGGASELYNSIIGLFYTIIIISTFEKAENKKYFFQNPFYKKLFIVYLFFSAAFLLLIIAPGNYLRDGLFPEHSFVKAAILTVRSITKFLIIYIPTKLIYLFAFAPAFVLLGISIKTFVNFSLPPFKNIFKKITLIFISTVVLFFYLIGFVMVETGPARVLFFVSFLFASYIVFISVYAGLTVSFKNTRNLKVIFIAVAAPMLLFHIINQSITASKYAKANDDRINLVLELKQKIKTDTLLFLPPLPPSGMLYSGEISADTTHFTNRELKMGYELPFNITKGEK